MITWHTSTRDPTRVTRVQTLIRSQTRTQDQKGQSISFTLRFPPQFFLFPPLPRLFYYFPSSYSTSSFFIYFFPSTTTTKFLLLPSSTTTTTTFMLLSLLLLFSYQTGQKGQPHSKIAKIRPKRPNSGQKNQLKEPILLVGKQ